MDCFLIKEEQSLNIWLTIAEKKITHFYVLILEATACPQETLQITALMIGIMIYVM